MRLFYIQTIGLFILAVVCGTARAESPEISENAVVNPGFEDGIAWPTGWWTKSPAHCSHDKGTSHSGSKSLRLAVVDPKKRVIVGQSVNITPGESYDISSWIRAENVSPPEPTYAWNGPESEGGLAGIGVLERLREPRTGVFQVLRVSRFPPRQ